jgi:hypothetical protein
MKAMFAKAQKALQRNAMIRAKTFFSDRAALPLAFQQAAFTTTAQ